MKKILCYGDSNTFGFNPENGERFDENSRWSAILADILKDKYEIIEQGMNNRCAVASNPQGELFCAQKHFPKLLDEIEVDILILALGTNDLQFLFDLSCSEIEKGVEKLILKAKEKIERIILIPPVKIKENILNSFFKIQFDKTSILKSKEILKNYKNLAKKYNLELFDFNEFVEPSEVDGLHYYKEGHEKIAKKLGEYLK